MRASCSAGVSPSGLSDADPLAHLALQAGDPDHEEFVEIVGRNREKPDPFQQRMSLVSRLLEHTAIEMQPGQLPVDEALRTLEESSNWGATGGAGSGSVSGVISSSLTIAWLISAMAVIL